MQLTKHTDYAFRTLIYLASMKEAQTTIQHIANTFGLSKPHLMKIVNKLATIGWVKSTRGKNGGIALAVDATAIRLNMVIEEMENTLDPINCAEPPCFINNVCRLKPLLMQAQKTYFAFLAQYTLQDLLDHPTRVIIQSTPLSFG